MHLLALGPGRGAWTVPVSLNAPFGARCFLTKPQTSAYKPKCGLNAPFGARCFLTWEDTMALMAEWGVLMHLLALGAF